MTARSSASKVFRKGIALSNASGLCKDPEGLLLHGSLHNPEAFERAIPFLKTLDAELLAVILSLRDEEGTRPLNNPAIFKKALPLLEEQFNVNNMWSNI